MTWLRNRLLVLVLPFLTFLGFVFIFSGHVNAIVWNIPPTGITQTTPNQGEHESDCAGQTPPGDQANVRCQTETIDNASYYSIWEPAPAPSAGIKLQVNYTCDTGYESFTIVSVSGGSISGTTGYSTVCMGSINKSGSGSVITVHPTDCSQYNGNWCETIIEAEASSPKSPNPATSALNPDNSGGYYGGNVYVSFTINSPGDADIEPAYSTLPGSNPGNGSSNTLSFGGFSVKTYPWPSYSRQASLYDADVKFQVPYNSNGSTYLAWKNANSNLDGSGTESWTLKDVTNGVNNPQSWSSNPNNLGAQGGSDSSAANDANNIYSSMNITLEACHTYEWKWSGQNGSDPIALSIPYPVNPTDLGLNCWSLSGASVVNDVGTTSSSNDLAGATIGDLSQAAYFNNQISNSGDYQASYTWKDQGCFFTNAEGESHCTKNASGDVNPNNNTNTYWYKGCTDTDAASGIKVNSGAVNCSGTLPISTNPYLCPSPPGTQASNPCPSYGGGKTAFQYKFSSASTADPGDGYCERIYYTNANGPSTDAFTSTPVCVTIAQWALTGTTKVGTGTLLPGDSTTFNSRVYNNGPDTASYWWWVQGCYYTKAQGSSHCSASSGNYNDHDCTTNNADASPCNLSTEGTSTNYITCPADNYCPAYDTGKAAESYSFPSSAGAGDGYCERIGYGNATGPGTSNDYSTIKCITYDTPPPGKIVSSCTKAAINTGSGYTVSFPNTTTTPSPGSVTPTGISYALYATNSSPGASPPGTTLAAGDFLPGEPGTAADDVANASPYSTYQNIGTNPAPPTAFPNLPGTVIASANNVGFKKQITVPLPSADLMKGNVTWYLVLFNHVGVESVPTSAGNYAAYYSNTVYIQKVSDYTTNNCFTPLTCTVNVSGTLGGQNTEAGKQFSYNVSYSYGGSAANSINAADGNGVTPTISATYTGDSGGAGLPAEPPPADVSIDPSDQDTIFYISPTAPNDTDSWNINVTIGYPGTPISDLASCSSPVNDYQPFNYTANALAVPIKSQADQQQTTENPGAIKKTYTYSESGSSTVPNNLDVTGGLYYIAAGGAPPSYSPVSCGQATQVECDTNLQQSSSPVVKYYTIPRTPNAGDSYCILVSLSPSTGYVGPGGNYLNPNNWPNSITNPNPASGGCSTIHNEPYASFTGNDVIGNTDFGNTCQQPSSSGIYTFSTNSSGNYTLPDSSTAGTGGSASQFGAQAVSIIEGFGSASFRNASSNYLPKGSNALGLSFANGNDNTNNVSPGPPTDGNPMGGDFGYSQNDSSCEPDYFDEDKPLSTNMINVNTGNIDQELSTNNSPATATATNPYNGYNYYSSSSITIGDGSPISIHNGVKATIFVNGDVYIKSKIVYSGANGGVNGWQDIADIPSFYIIAKGNIYIAPNVTQLDGAYIAQPTSETSSNTGIIDTCANGFQAYNVSALYGDSAGCDQQLTVNGAFVDRATLLDRSFSSLRYSEAGENTISSFTGHGCGNPGEDVYSSYGNNPQPDCAAEVFNFSPELYLSQPSYQPASGPTIGKYNFITSVSPTL